MTQRKQTFRNYWFLWLTIIVGLIALLLKWSGGICYRVPDVSNTGGTTPVISCPTQDFVSPITIILIIWLAAMISMMKLGEMIRNLRQGNFGIDILAIVAIGACLYAQEYSAAYVIILMLSSGEALEKLANRRANRELSALIKRRPQTAHIVIDDTISNVPLAKIKIGDILLVKANEVVPVDGTLVSSHASMNESSITGESMPVDKKPGDKIISGTLCETDAIHIRATTDARSSYYSQLVHLVEEAQQHPAHFVNMANRYAVPFTIISLIIAGVAWYWSGDVSRFAQVLVVASPCPLILAAPIAFISGISRASHRGIIVKGGSTLEQVARADVFAFDKTGTITTNQVAVDHIDAISGYTPQLVVSIAAAVEAVSTHVLASGIVTYAEQNHIQPAPAHSIREATGGGIFATIDRRRVVVGSPEFLRNNHIKNLPEDIHEQTAVLVAAGGKYIGAIYFTNSVRPGAHKALASLRRMGVRKIIMLTGDRQATATQIGRRVGVDKIYSQLSPTDKLDIVKQYSANRHHVAMVGDGINDAPVLATADVGIAMGVMGSTVAGETADAIITSSHISRIAELRQISQRTIRVARQSVLTGMVICLGLEVIALFGFIPAVMGAILQEAVDVLTMLNALRARR